MRDLIWRTLSNWELLWNWQWMLHQLPQDAISSRQDDCMFKYSVSMEQWFNAKILIWYHAHRDNSFFFAFTLLSSNIMANLANKKQKKQKLINIVLMVNLIFKLFWIVIIQVPRCNLILLAEKTFHFHLFCLMWTVLAMVCCWDL